MKFVSILFEAIFMMSITASFAAVIVSAAGFLIRKVKAPRLFAYALWAAVFIRSVCPLAISSPWSPLALAKPGIDRAIEMQSGYVGDYSIHPRGSEEFDDAIAAGINPEKDHPDLVVTAPDGISKPKTFRQSVLPVLSMVWISGVLSFLLISVFSYVRIKRRIQTATLLQDNIYETDRIHSAFVFGLLRPKIYLPLGIGDRELPYILEHERTHIRRFDHWIKLIYYCIVMLHWFNPILWFAFFRMTSDMEASCDESVVNNLMGFTQKLQEKANYSKALLTLAAGRRFIPGAPPAFGESNVKERVKNIMKYRKPSRGIVIAALLFAIALSLGLMLTPEKTPTQNEQPIVSVPPAAESSEKEPVSEQEETPDNTSSENEPDNNINDIAAEIADLVSEFGSRLQEVSLLAPEDILAETMRDVYGDYVDESLLESWASAPAEAPGRLTSSPWPDRIEIEAIEEQADGSFKVTGSVIEVARLDADNTDTVATRSISLKLSDTSEGWRIVEITLGDYEDTER